MKYKYKSETDKKGNVTRYKIWNETFIDQDGGKDVVIERRKPIKLNGVAIRFYSNSEIRRMSKKERDSISLKPILK